MLMGLDAGKDDTLIALKAGDDMIEGEGGASEPQPALNCDLGEEGWDSGSGDDSLWYRDWLDI